MRTFKAWTMVMLFLAVAQAQERSMSFGGAEVKLGMQKDSVSALLGSCGVRFREEGDNFLIFNGDPGSPNYESIGALGFPDGKHLGGITKDWGDFRSIDALNFAEAIASLIANENDRGNILGEIRFMNILRTPKHTGDQISIAFGKKKIVIDIINDKEHGRWLQVSEKIENW